MHREIKIENKMFIHSKWADKKSAGHTSLKIWFGIAEPMSMWEGSRGLRSV